ncbi:hypothetical protein ILYODFUR_036175 [Ilyodon furcidens]|uniref:Uncharacterized protein n=1 Tax=Ilyodon furcidens TaxID=33524 RepID=A0ABV0VMM2_9TELE
MRSGAARGSTVLRDRGSRTRAEGFWKSSGPVLVQKSTQLQKAEPANGPEHRLLDSRLHGAHRPVAAPLCFLNPNLLAVSGNVLDFLRTKNKIKTLGKILLFLTKLG